MDILTHALWAGASATLARRYLPITPAVVVSTVVLALLPDVFHLLPIIGWWVFADGSFNAVWAYAIAVPGQLPVLPEMVEIWSHHLHCIAHSAIVAGVVTSLVWTVRRALWIPLLGWWSHILIDIFTHSADYFPSPVLYPITERGFDGLAWNTPWFMVVNYTVLAVTGLWLWHTRKKSVSANPDRKDQLVEKNLR